MNAENGKGRLPDWKTAPPMRPDHIPPLSVVKPPDDWHDDLVRLIDLAYEGAWDLADRAGADFSIVGEPLERALRVLRDLRP